MPAGGLTVVLIAAVCAGLYFGGKYTVKGVKKVDHAICRAATLGHKCKPKVKPQGDDHGQP